MKYGVIYFSYANSTFEEKLEKEKHISLNIGDYVQAIAVRNLYKTIGIKSSDIIEIDRDTLPSYRGQPVILVMNGCFFKRSFPIPDTIIPVFIGFQAKEAVIVENLDYFKAHEPIGCRDPETAGHFKRHGVAAFVTGCLTLTFPQRKKAPETRRTLVIHGAGVGAFPAEALASMPTTELADIEFIFQRKVVHTCPVSMDDMRKAEDYAAHLLKTYRSRASLVITPLHHAAAPCIAMGIPVIICRTLADSRFGFLESLLPVHIRPDFRAIDWNPAPVNIDRVRDNLIESTRNAIHSALG